MTSKTGSDSNKNDGVSLFEAGGISCGGLMTKYLSLYFLKSKHSLKFLIISHMLDIKLEANYESKWSMPFKSYGLVGNKEYITNDYILIESAIKCGVLVIAER